MPKQRKKREVQAECFRWLLGERNGVFFADGRANQSPLGRHSLGTRDENEAIAALKELDLTMAIRRGMADKRLAQLDSAQVLSWAEGRTLYEAHTKRPRIAGGPRPVTFKRYRAVLDKFIPFAESKGRRTWNEVNRQLFDEYAGWLDGEAFAYATEYLELTTLKQIVKFLIENQHIPSAVAFGYSLKKPDGTDTYCWKPTEVAAILEQCSSSELVWLRHVVMGLAATGLRISELASLRWSDIDLQKGLVTLTDESTKKSRHGKQKRTTKSGRDRTFPIHQSFREMLSSILDHSDGLVFHGPLGGKIKADTVRRIFIRDVLRPLAERFPSEPGESGFVDGRLHSFRHYFCSNCANSGVRERVLMTWLGHQSSRMVHRYYHLHDEESIRQMEQVQLY